MANVIAIGLVSYADDPEHRVFRTVWQMDDDPVDELHNPYWTTMGCDPARTAVIEVVAADDVRATAKMTGTP